MNQAQKIFVEQMIKHGDENKAVLKAYPHIKGNNKLMRTYCGRLMKNEEIFNAIKKRSQKIEEIATQKAAEELKDKIVADVLSSTEKRNLLADIARGKSIISDNGKRRKPDFYERLKAIEVDNKMSGDNAPDKVDHNVGFTGFLKAFNTVDE